MNYIETAVILQYEQNQTLTLLSDSRLLAHDMLYVLTVAVVLNEYSIYS